MDDEQVVTLRKAATAYRRADERSRQAASDLATAVRKAYADGASKADILRAIDHVWSRTWVDKAVGGRK